MLWFLKKKGTDPDKIAFERYKTDFGLFQSRRFPDSREETYSCRLKKHSLWFELVKKNHFAWVPSALYQYGDFYLESSISFDEFNGHSACGFIFRYLNNENFYYFLVSNRGMFRFDVVFNGHPSRIIEWTPSSFIETEHCSIRIIAHGSHFSFYASDEWIAEIDDEKLPSGKIGIAAQNFEEHEKAVFNFNSLLIESRPVNVEQAFWRWVHYIPVEAASRVALAKTLMEQGNYTAAVVELKKTLKREPENQDALMLYAVCTVNLKVYDQALSTLEKIIAADPSHREAILEKANVLYLSNEFLKARDFIMPLILSIHDSSMLYNLLGNCEYSLGNCEKAAEAYAKACELEPTMPLYFSNLARMLERCGKPFEALDAYLKAAQILFRQEAYNDLSLIMPRIVAIDPHNAAVLGFEAKMLFQENNKGQAGEIFEKLIAAGSCDASVYFLQALILIEGGKRERALELLEKAVTMEPGYTLFWWRLAETKRLLGKDCLSELEKARKLEPENPWVNNLFGLYYRDGSDFPRALAFLENAHTAAPEEIDITINLSDLLHAMGKKEEARSLVNEALSLYAEDRLYNHAGNLAAHEGNFEQAVAEYEKALKQDPQNALYMENCAASCIEADMITRADELLVKLVDQSPSPSVYNLLGNLAVIRTEYRRAELSYQEGLRLDPSSREIKLNLAALYTQRSQYVQAKALIDEVLAEKENKRAIALRKKLQQYQVRISCSGCKREWWVWRDIPQQEAGKLYDEPPAESPAGLCPKCGKVFCIACARSRMKDKRFVCPSCHKSLKLDNYLQYLVLDYLKRANPQKKP